MAQTNLKNIMHYSVSYHTGIADFLSYLKQIPSCLFNKLNLSMVQP